MKAVFAQVQHLMFFHAALHPCVSTSHANRCVIGLLHSAFCTQQREELTMTANRSVCACIYKKGKIISSHRVTESLTYWILWIKSLQLQLLFPLVFFSLLLTCCFCCLELFRGQYFWCCSLPARMLEWCHRTENGWVRSSWGTFTFAYFLAFCRMAEGFLFSSLLWFVISTMFHLTLHTTASRLWRFAAG